MTEYKYSRKEIAKMRTSKKLMTQCWLDTVLLATKPESPKESKCECPREHDGIIEVEDVNNPICLKCGKKVIFSNPLPDIEPLRLIETTTSRNELRQTEKEIMIENKLNELIDRLNTLSKIRSKKILGEISPDYQGEKGDLYKITIDNSWQNELDGFIHKLSESTKIELSGMFYEELERFIEHLLDNKETNLLKTVAEATICDCPRYGDGHFCTHHSDDPAHNDDCYVCEIHPTKADSDKIISNISEKYPEFINYLKK